MPQINSGDFKKGTKVIVDGAPFDMIEVEFRKPGKGQAMYRTKLRNLLSGKILDVTYRSGDSLEAADVHRANGQYLYRDSNGFVFMDDETFEQDTLPTESFEERAKFLMEGAPCLLLYWNGQLIDVDPPQHVVLEITFAEPAARGDTATNVTKPATVETGATVNVPAFINQGDKIKIDCANGAYVERVRD